LTKPDHFEAVCANVLIRVSKEKSIIEIKKDLTKFEENFYEFQKLDFAGLNIIVSNFTAYSIYGLEGHLFMVINPKPSVVKSNQKP
jgi:hypothetical protein